MKTEQSVSKGKLIHVCFCLGLALALLCGVFVASGGAAGVGKGSMDIMVDNCSTHTAVVNNGDLYVWGTNDHGQFPNSTLPYSVEPVKVASNVAYAAVAGNRTMVLYTNGDLYSYGRNPLTGKGGEPQLVDTNVAHVDCAEDFTLYVTKSGALKGWGYNDVCQLGLGDTQARSEPTEILESNVVKVQAGGNFSLALMKDNTLWAWGANEYQQVGVTNEDGSVPETVTKPVQIAENVKDVSAGTAYTCFLTNSGEVYTCGLNTSSQTGAGTVDDFMPITKISEGVEQISAGGSHGFAVLTNGTVYSWGYGLEGQLGNTTGQRIPLASPTDFDFVTVFAGENSSFGVDSSGSLWSWGRNTNLLLATDTGIDAFQPVKVLNADMTWVFSESKDDNEPDNDHGASGGGTVDGDDTPVVVNTPFVTGDGNGLFRPDDSVTRAEFLKMAVIAHTDFDENKDYGSSGFTDVDDSKWYAKYIAYAKQAGLISGSGDNTFKPNDKITRAEAAKIAALAMKLTCNATESSFKDVTGFAVPYVEALAEAKVVSGDGNGLFRPKDSLTRGEAVKLISAIAFDPKEAKESISSVKNPFADVSDKKWYYGYIMFAHGLV